MKNIFTLLFILLACNSFAREYTVSSVPNPKLDDASAYVSNPDKILSQEAAESLNITLDALERGNSSEVAVVVLESIGEAVIENFAWDLFQEWGIGKNNLDNGLLVLFVLDQRKVRFETGYGLEGILPDAICKRIQMNDMVPKFRDGDYDAGMIAGVERAASVIRGETFDLPAPKNLYNAALIADILLLLLAFGVMALIAFRSTRNRKTDSYTRYKTSCKRMNIATGIMCVILFFITIVAMIVLSDEDQTAPGITFLIMLIPIPTRIFGALLNAVIKRNSYPCVKCKGNMRLLPRNSSDLSNSHKFEQKIGSVRYYVYKCATCGTTDVFSKIRISRYEKCPDCQTIAYRQTGRKVLEKATYAKSGKALITYKCLFCAHTAQVNKRIPKLVASSSSGSGSSSSSSSSSSSGGSFGGGSSGGGGSTSSW